MLQLVSVATMQEDHVSLVCTDSRLSHDRPPDRMVPVDLMLGGAGLRTNMPYLSRYQLARAASARFPDQDGARFGTNCWQNWHGNPFDARICLEEAVWDGQYRAFRDIGGVGGMARGQTDTFRAVRLKLPPSCTGQLSTLLMGV